jgi:hypothetical protein
MPLPRPRRLLLVLALMVWVGGVWLYWRTHLPLIPIDEIRAEDGWAPFQFFSHREPIQCDCLLENGYLVLTKIRNHEPDVGFFRYDSIGPIRIWDPVHHRVVHEIPEVWDDVLEVQICKGGSAAIWSGSSVAVLDLVGGRVNFRIAVNRDSDFVVAFSPDERLIALGEYEGKALTVYEVASGRIVFEVSAEALWGLCFVGPEALIARDNARILGWNTHTWTSLPGEGFPRWVEKCASDGTRGVTVTEDEKYHVSALPGLHDLDELSWEEAGRKYWYFSSAREDLITVFQPDAYKPYRVIRRRLLDGQRLTDIELSTSELTPRSAPSPDGEILVAVRERRPLGLSFTQIQWLQSHGVLDWRKDYTQLETVAVNTTTGRPVCRIADYTYGGQASMEGEAPDIDAEFCATGFVVHDSDRSRTRFFAYPLQRRWGWLLAWSLTPPAAIFLVTAGLRRWRCRKRPAVNPPPTAVA